MENPAGRLHVIFANLKTKSGQGCKIEVFASLLSLSAADWSQVLLSYALMREEFESLKREVETLGSNKYKYELYQRNLPDIEQTLKSFVFNVQDNSLSFTVNDNGYTALGFMAADLESDGTDDVADTMQQLRQLASDMQFEIDASNFPEYFKAWLLELVRAIRDAVDRYQIRGAKGIQRELSFILGELFQHAEIREEIKEKSPSLFSKIMQSLDAMGKIMTAAEKLKPAIALTRKAIPFIKSVLGYDSESTGLPGLPAPPTDLGP